MNSGPHAFQASTLPLGYVPIPILGKHSYGLLILLIENMLAFTLADPCVCVCGQGLTMDFLPQSLSTYVLRWLLSLSLELRSSGLSRKHFSKGAPSLLLEMERNTG